MNQSGISYLLSTQHADGGWGYGAGSASAVEPSAAAILALAKRDASEQTQKAVDWLITIQNPDGGWGFNAGDHRSGWVTAWAVLALSRIGGNEEEIGKGAAWLSAVEVYRLHDNDVLQAVNQTVRVDFALQGWSWGPGEASWVQPTAMALLALHGRELDARTLARIEEASQFLDNRRVPGGGWNVGNPAMFAGVLPAHAIPTSLALIALHQIAPERVIPGDIGILKQDMVFDGGAKALAYGMLALRALDIEDLELQQKLAEMQQPDGAWEGDAFTTALALLGLEGGI